MWELDSDNFFELQTKTQRFALIKCRSIEFIYFILIQNSNMYASERCETVRLMVGSKFSVSTNRTERYRAEHPIPEYNNTNVLPVCKFSSAWEKLESSTN